MSSLAAGHKTLLPALMAELKRLGRPDILVVADRGIPRPELRLPPPGRSRHHSRPRKQNPRLRQRIDRDSQRRRRVRREETGPRIDANQREWACAGEHTRPACRRRRPADPSSRQGFQQLTDASGFQNVNMQGPDPVDSGQNLKREEPTPWTG
jgi:hypothetical protein